MPRNVRNFWIEASVDGRKTPIKFGPQGKDGGFSLTVYMRNEGKVEAVLGLQGKVDGEKLILWVGLDNVAEGGQKANYYNINGISRQR